MQHRLHPVFARRELGEILHRKAEDPAVQDGRRTRRQSIDIDAEDLRRIDTGAHLEPRLAAIRRREDQDDPAVDRLLQGLSPERDRELEAGVHRKTSGGQDEDTKQGGNEALHGGLRQG